MGLLLSAEVREKDEALQECNHLADKKVEKLATERNSHKQRAESLAKHMEKVSRPFGA